jgi:shikimate kinase
MNANSSLPVFLIGFMGSGKSTFGKRIAAGLSYQFLDLDKAIENWEGKSIPEIFASQGEDAFRVIESSTLKQMKGPYKVIACGGGTPCFANNMDYMLQHGRVVYLKTNAGILATRLIRNKGTRPLLDGKSDEEIKAYVSEKLAERESFYEKAHIIFDAQESKLSSLLDQLR